MDYKKNLLKKGLAALVLSLGLLVQTKINAQELPNIVIIYADDLGYGDLSAYGGNIPTPNIDRLGQEGIRFTDFYASAPSCTPSRFSLLTGMYPQRSRHQLLKALMPFSKNYLDESERTLASYLRESGYKTALFGKWHLGRKDDSDGPLKHGFDVFSGFMGGCIDYFTHVYGEMGEDWYVNGKSADEPGYSTALITHHAIDFIHQTGKREAPFFLYLAYNAPHYGKTDPSLLTDHTVSMKEGVYNNYRIANTLQVPPGYLKRFPHVTDPYRKTYMAMVSCLDDQIGKVLKELEQQGLLQNTMIWFISDNGGYAKSYFGHADNGVLRGEKATLWEGGIRVPALLLWKNTIAAGQVIRSPVCNVDLLPTIGNIVGFKNSLEGAGLDGVDISPLLFHGKEPDRSIYWEYGEQTAIRKGAWKLVNGEELYNLEKDPEESSDLAKEYPGKVRELQSGYDKIHFTFPR